MTKLNAFLITAFLAVGSLHAANAAANSTLNSGAKALNSGENSTNLGLNSANFALNSMNLNANSSKNSVNLNANSALNSTNLSTNSNENSVQTRGLLQLDKSSLAMTAATANSSTTLKAAQMPKAINENSSINSTTTGDQILMPATNPRAISAQKATNPRATSGTKAAAARAQSAANKASRANSATRATSATRTNLNATATSAKKKQLKSSATSKAKNSQILQKSAADKERGQEQQLGLMPSEIDSLNHNVFHADADAIRGARDVESAVRYLPFATIINTAGYGTSFDLRGQGRLSANGVKLYINGIPSTPIDSYYNPMPINTVLPQLVQEIEVFPGSGAILYGAGTKGGTINIITSKRQRPYFVVGVGYLNTTASSGNSYNAFAHASENFGKSFALNAGIGFSQLGGPREDDSATNVQGVLGATWNFALGQKIDIDADIYYGRTQSTPYNSFLDSDAILNAVNSNVYIAGSATGSSNEYNRHNAVAQLQMNKPTENQRSDNGDGDIDMNQMRLNLNLAYENEFTDNLKWQTNGFYQLNSRKYDTYTASLPYFVLGFADPKNSSVRGYQWFLPRPQSTASNNVFIGDGQRADLHFLDQSGSSFTENKFGLKTQFDWLHDLGGGRKGEFIIGGEIMYENSERKAKNHLREAIHTKIGRGAGEWTPSINGTYITCPQSVCGTDGMNSTAAGAMDYYFSVRALEMDLDSIINIDTMTTAIFAMERFEFNKNFSIMGGVRYEMKKYDVEHKDTFTGDVWRYKGPMQNADGTTNNNGYLNNYANSYGINSTSWEKMAQKHGVSEISENYSESYDNFIFEIAPAFRYSNTGVIYARGEWGYIAPPAWAMLQRYGIVRNANLMKSTYMISSSASNGTNIAQGNNQIDGITPVICNNNSGNNYCYPFINNDPIEFDFTYSPTNLKSESYYTAELGWKEAIGKRIIPVGFTDIDINALLFSANVFYTNSKDEFHFEGDTWSGFTYGNYEKSRRYGVELAFEQYLFGGILGLNESFTYLKAEKFENDEWSTIPYTYDYKATFGAALDVGGYFEIVDVSVGLWIQNSFYGNQTIYSKNLQYAGSPSWSYQLPTAGNNYQPVFSTTEQKAEKLDPYVISDVGLSIGINKNAALITVGIKNVFDTFYYDYYNADRSAVVNEYRYVIGRGRTVFLEGQYRY